VPVTELIVEDAGAVGVVMEDGHRVAADAV
jgi:hypothetical protein